MLMSCAIRSRTGKAGVGFLLNSASRVANWSCVALWRFWFFCCCVRVLFLGGRRELGAPAVAEDAGEGVEVDIMSTAVERGDCITEVGRFIPGLMSVAI